MADAKKDTVVKPLDNHVMDAETEAGTQDNHVMDEETAAATTDATATAATDQS
ncbi:hypothetical protein [Streptomyces sp. JW3]|uniref:hypothetical protein n=1 Tax=Streptomyces sp. JW3 TaxID=3456955 RepID=UPI003FA4730A